MIYNHSIARHLAGLFRGNRMNADVLRDRTRRFALCVIECTKPLWPSGSGKVLAHQVVRSATSVGANYRSACRANTKKAFAHKLSIVVEEADETVYWLELIRDSKLLATTAIDPVLDEADQILRIMAASLHTARAQLL